MLSPWTLYCTENEIKSIYCHPYTFSLMVFMLLVTVEYDCDFWRLPHYLIFQENPGSLRIFPAQTWNRLFLQESLVSINEWEMLTARGLASELVSIHMETDIGQHICEIPHEFLLRLPSQVQDSGLLFTIPCCTWCPFLHTQNVGFQRLQGMTELKYSLS